MTRITVEGLLQERLRRLVREAELCDEAGQVLGRFTPIAREANRRRAEPQLSDEELQRRDQEPDYSSAEVLAQLQKL